MTLPRDEQPEKRAAEDSARSVERQDRELAATEHGLRPGLEGLRDLMDRLLAPDGCPWDREQTLDSLRPYLVEETYEVLESMHDADEHQKELGDLLFQIVFQSALRERAGEFTMDEVIDGIRDKLVRRHPHVFRRPGGPAATEMSADEVAARWEQIKAAERAAAGVPERSSPLDRVPRGLPALDRARKLQSAAAKLGFDWPDLDGPRAKVDEEWLELREAIAARDRAAQRAEYGDLLFVLVRLGQKLGIDPETALCEANAKFERRFEHVLRRCRERGIQPEAAGLEQLDAFWNEAKRDEPGH